MFDQLMNIVRQFGQKSVVENPAVPNQHNEAVMQEAGESIWSQLKKLTHNGDSDGVSAMLQPDPENPVVAETKKNFVENIMQKFGMDNRSAYSVANNLIPAVLGSLIKRRSNPNASGNGFNLSSLLGALTGNHQTGSSAVPASHPSLLTTIGSKLGLDKDGDGDVDLQDLSRLVR